MTSYQPPKLEFANKLIGRDDLTNRMLKEFKNAGRGHGRALLVPGHSGIGKTSLVQWLKEPVESENGLFVQGKFDQYQQNTPYYAIQQALQQLWDKIQLSGKKEHSRLCASIRESLGDFGFLLTELIHELGNLIEKPTTVDDANINFIEARHRFTTVIREFLKIVCLPEHPVVIFVDDWQWADAASLELLKGLYIDEQPCYFLFIVSYRDEEVNKTHPLSPVISELIHSQLPPHVIEVHRLNENAARMIIKDALGDTIENLELLTKQVHKHTEGNPFYLKAFLEFLYDNKMLYFDSVEKRWHWELEKDLPKDIVALFIKKLSGFEPKRQKLISLAACIGNVFDLNTLCEIYTHSTNECHASLQPFIASGLVLPLSDHDQERTPTKHCSGQSFMFMHDRVQQAAYLLIEPEKLAETHLDIGRFLLSSLNESEIEENLFEIVGHINTAESLIHDPEEQRMMVDLNMDASLKARSATAYSAMLQFNQYAFTFAEKMAGDITHFWDIDYEKALLLHRHLAESEFLEGDRNRAAQVIQQSLGFTKTAIERAESLTILIVQHTLLAKYSDAIDSGRQALSEFGIILPADNFQYFRDIEIERVREKLKNKSISGLYDLPIMNDPEMLTIIKILITLGPPCYRTHQHLWSVIVPKVVNLTLDHGLVPQIGYSHTAFGGLLGWVDNDYTAARQFEELAERIMTSRFESPSDQSVFYLMIGSSTRHWFSHLKDASQDYQKAYEIGKQYGNLQYAAYAFGHNMYCCFFQGMHLPQLIQDTKQSLVFSKTRLNHWATDLLEGGLSTFEALAEIHVVSEDGKIDDVQYLKQVKENKNIQVLCIYYILKTFYHVLLGNHRHALTLSDEAEQLIYTVGSQGLLPWPEHLCIKFLILTALYEDADTQTQAKWKSELYGIRDKLQLWNENCSENYSHKYLLIQAEIKRIENQQAEAILLYDHAIEAANQNEFVQWEGLANERACHFWSVRQNGYLAQIYWQQAYTCYHKWGANAKINLMENEFRKNLSSWFSDRYQDNTFITIQLDKKRIGFCEKHIKLQKSHSRDKLAFQHQGIVKKEADDLADAINRLRAETAERKRIEQALKESEDKYRQMFEDNTAIKLLIDPENGDIVDNNSGASNFYGYDHNQFRKIKITDINILSPEEINAEMQKAKSSNRNHFIFKHKLASGEMRDVEVHSGPITYKGRTLLFSIIHDITDRKRMEEQQRQTHKMESIGTLAGGIAHEFNNILSIIIGNNELIMEDLPEWSLSRECADEIRLAGLRARDIVKHLLTFSRQDDSIKKSINIRSVVKESLRLIRSTTPTNIEIRDSFSPDCFPVFGDATQVNQILINLVNNAVYALPISGGRIDVELSNTVIDHMTGFSKNELAPGKYVRLLVRDNGSGMDKEILEKIFEPYFTTKDVNEGSGLGLSVVHGIVENHNGSITCDSKKGQGTTFTILIPAHDGPVETESKQKNTLPGRGESILYIDDEPSIAKLGKRHLQALGYEAFSITNPVEALDMVKSEPNRFDLIISDMAMPKMPGDQLIAEILIIKPDMPTIICTGYSSRISETEAAKMGVKAFLMKPLNKTELAKKVRQVLDDSIENEK